MSGMLIDSIMGTIDHIYCDNTFHVITEQNHQRNTIVRPLATKSIFCWILWVRGGFLTSWLLWPLQKSILKIQALSGCNIKAKIKGFLLVYRLFQCKHWFLPNLELKDFPDLTSTPCRHKRHNFQWQQKFKRQHKYQWQLSSNGN